ncbi:MAG: MFS family permease [Acidimicrobiales bacterium]|jgi:MFS family permease
MTAGSLVAAAGIALIGQVRTTWQMFAVFVLFGTGYAFAGLVPTTSLVTRWFHRRRSLALAIASTGLSMGGIAITPLLAQLIEKRSLVSLAPWFAVAYLAGIIPIVWLLLRVSPESMGLRPDGDAPAFDEPDDVVLPGTSFALAVRSGYFKIVSVGFVILMSAQVGALQHLFKLTKDRIDIDAASLALIVVTATSVVGRIAGGLAAMRFPLMRLVSVLAVVQAIGIAIIAVSDSIGMILLGCVVLGSAMGNLLMLHPLLLADAFGVRDYSRIYGLGALLMVFGVGLGPFNVGILRDATDYRTAFLAMAALALVGLAVLRLAPAPPTPDSGPH